MTDRILDITEDGYHLRTENFQFVLERKGAEPRTIPVEDIAVLILSNRQTTCSQCMLAELAKHGGTLVVCDERSLPVAMMMPLVGHTLQAERLAQQVKASKPMQKQLWQQLVRAKVTAQAGVLTGLHGTDAGLLTLVSHVRSGDPDNIEAQAAQRYWPALFEDTHFRRQPHEGDPPNHLLDYGYAVLRAMVARAIVGSGLNVTFGIHHHNRSNAYCLADDVMEPFRPIVDKAVFGLVAADGPGIPLNKETKRQLIAPLLGRLELEGEWRTVSDVLALVTANLAAVYAGEIDALSLPQRIVDIRST